jgi:hypothetical protein
MSSTDLAVRSNTRALTHAEDVALRKELDTIADTDFVPKAYRGKRYEMYACVLTGRALGLDPMTSLRQIYVVDGKATLSAELMVALVRRAGHSISGSSSATAATARGVRADNGDEFEVSFTIEEAKKIKTKESGRDITLDQKTVWKHYPADMLWARAVSRLCRRLFPDLLAGVSYTPDEVTLTPEERNAEATDDLPLPPDPEDSSAGRAPFAGIADDQEPGAATTPAPLPIEDAEIVEQEDGSFSLPLPADVRRNLERDE